MKLLFLLLLITDTDALNMSRYLWGDGGWTKRAGKNFQIGCTYQGLKVTVSTSKISWEDAFSKVDLRINGPRVLDAVARDDAGNSTISKPVRIFVCNAKR